MRTCLTLPTTIDDESDDDESGESEEESEEDYKVSDTASAPGLNDSDLFNPECKEEVTSSSCTE